jgi:hypothetical protein
MGEGGSPVGDWIIARAPIVWPERCCVAGELAGDP